MSAGRRPQIPSGPYLVVGLARSGLAAARALRDRGGRVIGVDVGRPPGAEELATEGVEIHMSDQGTALLDRAHVVIKSPGVPAQAPVIAAARERGVPVLGELELGWRLLDNEFIAVTGTNGKTTTVELIGHVHRAAGLAVAVAGNVGAPVSGLIGAIERDATVVCETSSFQLEDAVAFAPEAAVLLNIAPDHLDRHGTFDDYVQAKLSIFERQDERDLAVLPAGLVGTIAGRAPVTGRARAIEFGDDPAAAMHERDGELVWRGQALLATSELRLRGRHNVENAMAAAAVCLARGIEAESVREGLRSFRGVAHRLEQVATLGGVTFVNDSKATNVQSTLVALEAFADAGAIHLILGGQGKGQDFAPLREPVERWCTAVYLTGEDSAAIARAMPRAGVSVHDCGDLEQAVAQARAQARSGEVVLLSPACASFDQFADFEARGERFRDLIAAAAPD